MLQLNILQKLRWLSVGAATIALAACDPSVGPTSQNALDSSVEKIDNTLLGAWYGELGGVEAYVHVVDSTNADTALRTLFIGQPDRTGHSKSWGKALATPAKIGTDGYLSIRVNELEGQAASDQDYVIVRYRVRDHRHVSLYAMDPDRVADAIRLGQITGSSRDRIIAGPDELVRFIQAAEGQDLFSVQIGYLERVSEDAMPRVTP